MTSMRTPAPIVAIALDVAIPLHEVLSRALRAGHAHYATTPATSWAEGTRDTRNVGGARGFVMQRGSF